MEGQFSVGPWAKEKLNALEKYLIEYTKIMRKQRWCEGFVYVDAFAGPGTQLLRKEGGNSNFTDQLELLSDFQASEPEQIGYIRGSPRVALDIQHPFSAYIFIEQNEERARELAELEKEYRGRRRIRIKKIDCNQYLKSDFIDSPRVDWKKWRALIFLDPFGMQVPWSTIEGLAKTGAVEIIINFPVGMAIQRMLKRDGKISENIHEKLDEYFGSSEWFEVVYRSINSLFGKEIEKVEESGKALVQWYREKRLKSVFKFVSSARLIRNSHGGHLYYIIHAGQNETGGRIADYILSQGETIS